MSKGKVTGLLNLIGVVPMMMYWWGVGSSNLLDEDCEFFHFLPFSDIRMERTSFFDFAVT